MVTSSIVANVLLYMYKKELQHQIAYQTQTVTHTVGDCCVSPEIKICTIQVVIACRVKEAPGILDSKLGYHLDTSNLVLLKVQETKKWSCCILSIMPQT
mmetsp:Transcript_3272/g.5173  ORF Transcript_3272/g.5173 Transcript_3272/m.5173 type:complete len:99 (+) Transcript_3272:390-686(+)